MTIDGVHPSRQLNIEQAAKRVRRGRRAVERWIASGDLPAVKVKDINGNVIRTIIDEEELLTCLRAKILARRNGRRATPDL